MSYTIEKSTACDDEGLVRAQRYQYLMSECNLDQLITHEFKDEVEAGPDYKPATVSDIEVQSHPSYHHKADGQIWVTVHLQLTYEYKDVEETDMNKTKYPILTPWDRDAILDAFKTGGGVMIDFTAIRPKGTPIKTKPMTPEELMEAIDKVASGVRRS